MSCRVQHSAFAHGGERPPLVVNEVVQSDAHGHTANGHVRYDDRPNNKLHFLMAPKIILSHPYTRRGRRRLRLTDAAKVIVTFPCAPVAVGTRA